MKWLKFFLIIFLMFFVVYGIVNSAIVEEYITTIKKQNFTENWEETIKNYAKKHNIPATEPRIDKVWKLIPGYNGLIIDEETTIALLKDRDISAETEIMYVWKEIQPKLHLQDLGPVPIYRGNENKPSVSFMINVAWGTEYLEPILQVLMKENVKATFFLDGSWLKKNPEMAKQIVMDGHEVGNHGYSHPLMSKLSDERIKEEIIKTEQLMVEILQKHSTLFAPPAGDYDQRVTNIAYQFKLKTVLWTLDTIDWKKPSPETIINRIVPKIGNGHLVLMHPTESTAKALPQLIRQIKQKGLKIGTVSETLSTNRFLHVEPLLNF